MPDDLRWSWWNHTRNKCSVTQLCPTLCSPLNSSGSSVHWILQARTLEWAVISFSRRSSNQRIEPRSPELQADSLPMAPPGNRKRNRVNNKWTALETSQNLPPPLSVKKKLSSKKLPRSRKELQVYSSVTGCWLREMLKQGVLRGRISFVWGQQTSNSLGNDGRDLFHFFKRYPCGVNLKLAILLQIS